MLRNLFPVTDEGVLMRGFETPRSSAPQPPTGGTRGSAAPQPPTDETRGSSAPQPLTDETRGSSAPQPPTEGTRGSAAPQPPTEGTDITVVHVAPSEPDSIFIRNLRELDEAGAINLVARYDDEHGVLDVSDLAGLVPDLVERTTYACGPGGLLDALGKHHEERGLELFTEQFRPVTVAAGEGGTVTLEKSGVSVELDGSTTILDAAEEAGVLMPSGCRMGICMGCVLPMREGAVRDLRNGEITTATPGETNAGGVSIQTCISAPAGPCHIDH
ncbi:2Fe-2S iron-sulfur cluster binding domain-containing protein [Nocardioides sp. JQ2195]|nr:2Fe-2S iron-sulfur cluster binding domain-containing protein [Nocardioides sp. JQ2195]